MFNMENKIIYQNNAVYEFYINKKPSFKGEADETVICVITSLGERQPFSEILSRCHLVLGYDISAPSFIKTLKVIEFYAGLKNVSESVLLKQLLLKLDDLHLYDPLTGNFQVNSYSKIDDFYQLVFTSVYENLSLFNNITYMLLLFTIPMSIILYLTIKFNKKKINNESI